MISFPKELLEIWHIKISDVFSGLGRQKFFIPKDLELNGGAGWRFLDS